VRAGALTILQRAAAIHADFCLVVHTLASYRLLGVAVQTNRMDRNCRERAKVLLQGSVQLVDAMPCLFGTPAAWYLPKHCISSGLVQMGYCRASRSFSMLQGGWCSRLKRKQSRLSKVSIPGQHAISNFLSKKPQLSYTPALPQEGRKCAMQLT
jgi:hypothetical protein